MRLTKRLALAAGLLFLVGASQVLADPFLWLEERNGEKAMAWVAEQNARTSAELRGDPRYDAYVDTAFELFTSSDNPAYGYVQGGHVYNFWQDDEHNLGTLAAHDAGLLQDAQRRDWETIIDFDALAATEGTNWVFSVPTAWRPTIGAACSPMSPDGGDALESASSTSPPRAS